MKHILPLILLLTFSTLSAQQKRIALTFDDLPCTQCADIPTAREVSEKLLKTLEDYGAPAIGFVNEGKLYVENELQQDAVLILETWLMRGMELGNHTFSHIDINGTELAEYEVDMVKGEEVIRRLARRYLSPLRYFRHPYLHTGETEEIHQALNAVIAKHGYTTAPVTIDNDEYIYAYCYHKAKMRGDSAGMRLIAYDYVAYMRGIVTHYEKLAQKLMGRPIDHVLLLHANELNADYLPALLDMLKGRGYEFVFLEEALKDPAYEQAEAVSQYGLSWLTRWEMAKGLKRTSMPEASDRILARFEEYRNGNEAFPFQRFEGPEKDIQLILENIEAFSTCYENKDYDCIAAAYTEDGKIMPGGADIIEGRKAIRKRWVLPAGQTVVRHLITPVEICVEGKTAYDHGYYEGETLLANGTRSQWYGKYVIVWHKTLEGWQIYLDIWNRL